MKLIKAIFFFILFLTSYHFINETKVNDTIIIDAEYYPFYSTLDANEQSVYRQIIEKINTYETRVLPKAIITIDNLTDIMNAIFYDHPEFFWLETSYSYKYSDNICIQITLNYNELIHDIENNKKTFNEKVNDILEKAKVLENDLEKEKYIHDYLIHHVSYDENSSLNQSAFSALVNESSVCAGYSRAFQYLMMELEIPTYYCSGTSNGNHAWNIILIDNEFYNVDVTWNDSNHTERFFNKNDKFFSRTHLRSNVCQLLPKSE